VNDPFAYLETSDARTAAWTAEQNARTRRALDGRSARAALLRRFDGLLESDVLGVPVERGGRVFFTARRGTADQASLFVRADGHEGRLLDPAGLDPSGVTAIDWWYPSPSGRYVAYGLSRNGDERSTLHVLAVDGERQFPEAIPHTRYASLAWLPDESGFYYTRRIGGDYDVRLFHHTLGGGWERDAALFGDGRKPEESLVAQLSADGRRLTVTVHDGWARSDVYLADTQRAPLEFVAMVEGREALYEALPTNGAIFIVTNEAAPRFRVMSAEPERPERAAWDELVPETEAKLDSVAPARGGLALHYLENVQSVVRVWRPGGDVETIDAFGRSVVGWSSSEVSPNVYVLQASFLEAATVVRLDVSRAPSVARVWDTVATPFRASDYAARQVWYASPDGTQIPMFVLAKHGTPRDGTAPAVLYGYGGFNVSLVPWYMPSIVPWLDAGGVYAIANLRGGGEFGEAWHRDGMLERKQNVFDDFIAAAQYLATSRIADPARIALMGGSNGGLLVAAVATQRPSLARAVVALVPLTDMLRFPEFLIARLWIAEYGDPAIASEAAVLRAYSPYHNVHDGVAYPAMLIATAEDDSRVDPMHARKFAARVQAATSGDAPILLYVEANAGHGAGKPRAKLVAELADRWTFIGWQLGGVFG
jgi:prolyl oligopeptidase